MVAAGSGPGGRTALACVVMLGLGPGVWALPGAPGGGPCLCPGVSGLPWARHSMGGLVQVLVPGWLLWDLGCVSRLLVF